MAATSPTRIDNEIYASAKLVGGRMSRSAAQQIAHWARIGRELEASHSVSYRDVADVLDGRRDYDELTDRQQAIVRAEWTERITERREGLNLTEQFAHSGRSYVELDQHGNIIRHPAQDGGPADA
ncbi:ParD-like family protein [Rhodococcus sp. NCIMB 12038]|jgi:hypothetical protein|uniref:ParD-like family protein n=1 Tax=Rhodococcus sp. NCIMB 12038 TaxID=933800 RepID=UPI00211AB1B0|nr:ParD-like family protein [Rhodococcus sp. NCIMB 12038]